MACILIVRGSWFDKLTMRESGAVRPTGNIVVNNRAEYGSLQSSLSLMVSLSNHGTAVLQSEESELVFRQSVGRNRAGYLANALGAGISIVRSSTSSP